MSELQQTKLWDDWDDINLSTSERRIERLEILLCQKVHKGEDISECLQVLEYLKNRTTEQKLETVLFQQVQSKLAFNSWHKVTQAGLAFLITITCFGGLFKLASLATSNNSLSELSLEPHSIKDAPHQRQKHYK
ncbi:hypothetical protein [Nostoc favosum]|uniref:Uncharacterized protein n=1 Tax=Nostoc favosum CHAB5714 TaxID=2780399 RepID=A0ABS8IJH0_9NOSO|nr:hypothetical protein [Nostoc favosum]MCC5603945.1 hypothetical protein [Nostoc favosum CHAB5714]